MSTWRGDTSRRLRILRTQQSAAQNFLWLLRRRRARLPFGPQTISGSDSLGALSDSGNVLHEITGIDKLGALSDSGTLNPFVYGTDTLGRLKDSLELYHIISATDSTGAPSDSGVITPPTVFGTDSLGALSDSGEVYGLQIEGTDTLGALADSGLVYQADVSLYSVYALEGFTGAAAEYTNFELELMQVGSVMMGVGASALYTLGGADDAGTDIDSVLRSGFNDFESGNLKRMHSARLAIDGTLNFKLRAIDQSDSLTEYAYTTPDTAVDSPNTRVVKIGRGIAFTYAGFELTNSSGADFEIDHLDLYPIDLARRR